MLERILLRARIRYYDREWHRLQAQIVDRFGLDVGDLINRREFCDTMEACLRNRLRQVLRSAAKGGE